MIGFVVVLATRKSAVDQQARSPLLDKIAPPLTGTDIAGQPFDLTTLRGKYVLVNFAPTPWCVPCQQEQPQLEPFANIPAHNQTVVGVLFEDTAGPAASFLNSNGGSWPALPDADGQHSLDWGVRGPPESYLVNPDGIVLAKFIGQVTAARLDQLVNEAQGAAAAP